MVGRRPDCLRRPEIAMVHVDQGPAGEVAIDDNLKDVVVQVEPGEIPVVVIGLVEEVEAVEALDPANLDHDIEILGIVVSPMAAGASVSIELVQADGVAVGHDRPILVVAVDPGDHVGGKLEDLEYPVGPLKCPARGSDTQCEQPQKEVTKH